MLEAPNNLLLYMKLADEYRNLIKIYELYHDKSNILLLDDFFQEDIDIAKIKLVTENEKIPIHKKVKIFAYYIILFANKNDKTETLIYLLGNLFKYKDLEKSLGYHLYSYIELIRLMNSSSVILQRDKLLDNKKARYLFNLILKNHIKRNNINRLIFHCFSICDFNTRVRLLSITLAIVYKELFSTSNTLTQLTSFLETIIIKALDLCKTIEQKIDTLYAILPFLKKLDSLDLTKVRMELEKILLNSKVDNSKVLKMAAIVEGINLAPHNLNRFNSINNIVDSERFFLSILLKQYETVKPENAFFNQNLRKDARAQYLAKFHSFFVNVKMNRVGFESGLIMEKTANDFLEEYQILPKKEKKKLAVLLLFYLHFSDFPQKLLLKIGIVNFQNLLQHPLLLNHKTLLLNNIQISAVDFELLSLENALLIDKTNIDLNTLPAHLSDLRLVLSYSSNCNFEKDFIDHFSQRVQEVQNSCYHSKEHSLMFHDANDFSKLVPPDSKDALFTSLANEAIDENQINLASQSLKLAITAQERPYAIGHHVELSAYYCAQLIQMQDIRYTTHLQEFAGLKTWGHAILDGYKKIMNACLRVPNPEFANEALVSIQKSFPKKGGTFSNEEAEQHLKIIRSFLKPPNSRKKKNLNMFPIINSRVKVDDNLKITFAKGNIFEIDKVSGSAEKFVESSWVFAELIDAHAFTSLLMGLRSKGLLNREYVDLFIFKFYSSLIYNLNNSLYENRIMALKSLLFIAPGNKDLWTLLNPLHDLFLLDTNLYDSLFHIFETFFEEYKYGEKTATN